MQTSNGAGDRIQSGALSGWQAWGPKGRTMLQTVSFWTRLAPLSTAEVAVHATDQYWWPGVWEELRGAPPGATLASLLTATDAGSSHSLLLGFGVQDCSCRGFAALSESALSTEKPTEEGTD